MCINMIYFEIEVSNNIEVSTEEKLMKQSVWFENYEKEVQKLQKNNADKKKILFLIIPIMFILFGVFGMAGGAEFVQVLPLFIVGAVVLLMAILLSKKANTSDKAKDVRQNLAELFKSDEEVDEFDAQMAKPLFVMKTDIIGEFIILEDYIGVKTTFGGWPDYRFAKKMDIQKIRGVSMKSGEKIVGKEFMIDLLDAEGKKKLGVSIEGKQRLQQWQQAMTTYASHIQI